MIDFSTKTHVGKERAENQDSVYISGKETPIVALVADGMGGHLGGKIASKMAVALVSESLKEHIEEGVSETQLKDIIEKASEKMREMANVSEKLKDMGSTVVGGVIYEDYIVGVNVGDSRMYMCAKGKLKRLTKDHSYVQYLIEKGILKEDENEDYPYKNIITRAMGIDMPAADTFTVAFHKGDVLLICSDGVTVHVKDKEIEECLKEKKTCEQKAQKLLSMALERGGKDNISIIVISNIGGSTE
jgi:serine/threonine protein phosphatase PrpC